MFDAKTAKNAPKSVLPENEQEENESRRYVPRLWTKLMTGYGQSSQRQSRRMICMELLPPSRKSRTSKGKRRERGKLLGKGTPKPDSSEMSLETGGCPSWILTGKYRRGYCACFANSQSTPGQNRDAQPRQVVGICRKGSDDPYHLCIAYHNGSSAYFCRLDHLRRFDRFTRPSVTS